MLVKFYKLLRLICIMSMGMGIENLAYANGDPTIWVGVAIGEILCAMMVYALSDVIRDLENEDTDEDEIEEEA